MPEAAPAPAVTTATPSPAQPKQPAAKPAQPPAPKAVQPPAEPPREPRRYKLSEKDEVSDDSSEFMELLRQGRSRLKGEDQLKHRFAAVDVAEKRVQAVRQAFKEGRLEEFAEEMGVPLRELVEKYAARYYEEDQLPPEQRERQKLQQERKAWEAEKKAEADKAHAAEVQRVAQESGAMLSQAIFPALEAAGLKGDALALDNVREHLKDWSRTERLTPEHVQRAINLTIQTLQKAFGPRVAKLQDRTARREALGAELYDAVRKDIYDEWKERKAQVSGAGATPGTKPQQQPTPTHTEERRRGGGGGDMFVLG